MTRKLFNRSTFSEETPILDTKPLKNYSLTESRNIIQMIHEIKFQTDLEARELKKYQSQDKKMKRPEYHFFKLENDMNQGNQDRKKWFMPKNTQLKGKKLTDQLIKDDIDDTEGPFYPNLLGALFTKLTLSAQEVKKNFKLLKGLNVDEEFVLVNVHECEYCGRKFPKPCALGGHISKLHSEERRRRSAQLKQAIPMESEK